MSAPMVQLVVADAATTVSCNCGWSSGGSPSSVLAFRDWHHHLDQAHDGQLGPEAEAVKAFGLARDEMAIHERLLGVAMRGQARAIRALRGLGLSTPAIGEALGLPEREVLDIETQQPPSGRR